MSRKLTVTISDDLYNTLQGFLDSGFMPTVSAYDSYQFADNDYITIFAEYVEEGVDLREPNVKSVSKLLEIIANEYISVCNEFADQLATDDEEDFDDEGWYGEEDDEED